MIKITKATTYRTRARYQLYGFVSKVKIFRMVSQCDEYKSILFRHFNPFISITPSKPLMSSGPWLTLHNCEIFYLLAVNYDPATTDLIFIRVNIYPGPGEGGSLLIFYPIHFIRVTIYPASLPHNISRGHYLPCTTYCLVLACIKAIIHIRPLRFCHDLANI